MARHGSRLVPISRQPDAAWTPPAWRNSSFIASPGRPRIGSAQSRGYVPRYQRRCYICPGVCRHHPLVFVREHHYYHDAFFGFGCFAPTPVIAYPAPYPVYVPYATVPAFTPYDETSFIPAPRAYSEVEGPYLQDQDAQSIDSALSVESPQQQAGATGVQEAPPSEDGKAHPQEVTGTGLDGSRRLSDQMLHDLMIEGTQAFAEGDYPRAARSFLQVAMEVPDNIDALLAYAVARFATGDYAVAAIAVRRGVRKFPDVVNTPFDIRDRYGRMGDFDRHLTALEAYVLEHPGDVDAWVVLGFVCHFTQNRELAARTFQAVKDRSPADGDIADTFLRATPPEEVSLPPEGMNDQSAQDETGLTSRPSSISAESPPRADHPAFPEPAPPLVPLEPDPELPPPQDIDYH